MSTRKILLSSACLGLLASSLPAEPAQLSGIYPSLAMFNNEGECGTGAVVPWADRLWVITYAPHMPKGSSDKLYEITPDLKQIIRPESIGGTPANRMIHRESNQLVIGPHVIDQNRKVRTIHYASEAGLKASPKQIEKPEEPIPGVSMFGRHTGNARHLTDPAGKILYATMEEGIYEVDLNTLAVKELWGDEANQISPRKADLPGYHGKGFYSGQGVYIYSNNGERGEDAKTKPETASGVLAEWDGMADKWTVIRRNQFTEVTGPGGIHGSSHPDTDPIWATGWDAKSLLLGIRKPNTGWQFFRLPKGSHSYDGAHGWNTEWPRIREIGEKDFLMTMHGTFWHFPADFGIKGFTGIRPRSNYLKVIGDFARWNDHIVFGCDDTAKSEFLNKRKAKGEVAAPQSQSNLWFVKPNAIDHFGPVIGRGAVWMKDNLTENVISDPYLFVGYKKRGLHLAHSTPQPATIILETGDGMGTWSELETVELAPQSARFLEFPATAPGEWIRLRAKSPITGATAVFTYRNADPRDESADPIFDGLAKPGDTIIGGSIHALGGNQRILAFHAVDATGKRVDSYALDADLKLTPLAWPKTEEMPTIPTGVISIDQASVIYTDDSGKRWRIPQGDPGLNSHPLGSYRVCREVATERDLFNAYGSFYELPANNAGGIAKLRPVATHNRLVHDFCSYRGLFLMSGIATDVPPNNPHILRSDDGKAALWAGTIDDIWKLGKPRGTGGPWKSTPVKAGQPSDPYLITAYDKKLLQLRFDNPANDNLHVTAQIDIHGDGTWVDYQRFFLENGETIGHEFPDAFSAYWIRFVSDEDTTATAQLIYR